MTDNAQKQKIIENYVAAYNAFDVEKMLQNLHERVVFRNVSGGAVNLTTDGIDEFRRQAERAKPLFSERAQKITGWKFGENEIEVEISYRGKLAADLPNGQRAGSEIELDGKSIFRFAGDEIIEIEDVS